MKHGSLAFVLVLFVARILFASADVAAQELLGWDVSLQTNSGDNFLSPTTRDPGFSSVDGLRRGSGIATTNTQLHGWGGIGWDSTKSSALDHNKFFTFGFTVAAGHSVSLSGITESYRRITGPDVGEIDYEVNGGAYTPLANLTFNSTSDGDTLPTINISDSALQNLAAGTSVEFRQTNWYSDGSTHLSTISWFIYNVNASGDDLFLTGTATPVSGVLIGDVNQDLSFDARDITAMLLGPTNVEQYQSTYGVPPTQVANILDVNQDTRVDNADLQWLLAHLKSGAGNLTAVPEPATWQLGLMSGAILILAGIWAECRQRRSACKGPICH